MAQALQPSQSAVMVANTAAVAFGDIAGVAIVPPGSGEATPRLSPARPGPSPVASDGSRTPQRRVSNSEEVVASGEIGDVGRPRASTIRAEDHLPADGTAPPPPPGDAPSLVRILVPVLRYAPASPGRFL